MIILPDTSGLFWLPANTAAFPLFPPSGPLKECKFSACQTFPDVPDFASVK